MQLLQHSFTFVSLLAAAAEAGNLKPRAPPPICNTLNSCYARFSQASTASAYCSSFLPPPVTKTTTTILTLSTSTKVNTKIITVKGTVTVPQTSTITGVAAYVTSYQPCTGTSASPSIGTLIPRVAVRQAPSGVPGCLQYLVAPSLAATTTACQCIVTTARTTITTVTKTVTPKVVTFVWTGTVSIASTVRPTQLVTFAPTYTVTMDPIPCALTVTTTPVPPPAPSSTSGVSSVTTPTSTAATTPTSSIATTTSGSAIPTVTDGGSVPSVDPATLCPAGGEWTSPDGSLFRVECNNDRGGFDADVMAVSSFEMCGRMCAQRGSECAGVSFVPRTDGTEQLCWIKYAVPAITYPPYLVQSLVRISSSDSADEAAISGIPDLSCTRDDGLTYYAGDGSSTVVMCGLSFTSDPFATYQTSSSFRVCGDACAAVDYCGYAAWDPYEGGCSFYSSSSKGTDHSSYLWAVSRSVAL